MKRCTGCGELKPLEAFGTQSRPGKPDDRKSRCKACHTAYVKTWRAANPEKLKEYMARPEVRKAMSESTKRSVMKRKYGLTPEQLEELLDAQARGCAICREPLRRWFDRWGERGNRADSINVDHCHETGRIRGLLCTRCNRGLGLFRDSPKFLRAAARYVEQQQLFSGAVRSGPGGPQRNK